MKAPILFSLLLLTLVSACSGSHSETTPQAQAASAPAPAVAVDTAKIEMRELQRSVEAVGTLDPNEEVIVTNQVEGIIERLFVDLGDSVRAGQVLAQLDTRELELAVQQQQAALQQELARLGLTDGNASVDDKTTSQVRQAEATFAEAKIRLDRTKKLVAEGVVPNQQLDEQQARYDVADAALHSARETVRNIRATISARRAALSLAEKKLSDAKITAPIAGFVKDRQVSQGQFLKTNSSVVTIVQNSPLKLKVDVPESAVAFVRAGGRVQFQVDAFPDRVFEGRIGRLSPSVDQQSRTLKLEALVSNSDGALKPGFFARVTIQTDRKDKALIAPAEALINFAGLEKIFVIDNGKVDERIVRSGVRVGNDVEIVEGVKEGELVAKSNLGNLQQGREVSVR
jgi:multidrug efflux pump subunit AcrA (membrane-fusion protein)